MHSQHVTTCPVLRRTLDLSACHSHTASPHQRRRARRRNVIDRESISATLFWLLLLLLLLAKMLLCCAARDCGPKSGKSGIRYSHMHPPQENAPLPLPPSCFVGAPPNLHRHRLCRRPPASIFSICRAPSHKSDGATDDVSAHLPPAQPNARHSHDCGDTRGSGEPSSRGGGGVVCSDQGKPATPRALSPVAAAAAAGESQSRLRPARLRGLARVREGTLLFRADLATWYRVSFPGALMAPPPPCSTLQVEEDKTAGGRSSTER